MKRRLFHVDTLNSGSEQLDFGFLSNVEWRIHEIKGKKVSKMECQNIVTFDIEASSGYFSGVSFEEIDKERMALDDIYRKKVSDSSYASLMYVWQAAIEAKKDEIWVVMGRTWHEFSCFMSNLVASYEKAICLLGGVSPSITNVGMYSDDDFSARQLCGYKTIRGNLRIYIHNLSYEFQFLRNIPYLSQAFSVKGSVFAREERKPMRAIVNAGAVNLIFTDTLCLTNKSLKQWGEDENLSVRKKEEPEDFYQEVRTPKTPMTDDEIEYSINDVETMIYGLDKFRERFEYLEDIPMTQTGIVRRRVQEIEKGTRWQTLCKITHSATDIETFKKIERMFYGGYTHANAVYSGQLVRDVCQVDEISAYPTMMTIQRFPVYPFNRVECSKINEVAKGSIYDREYRYFVMFDAYNVVSKTWFTYLSASGLIESEGVNTDNGKIASARHIKMILTDCDFELFNELYECEKLTYDELYISKADYLSGELVGEILRLFGEKTKLKGISGKESVYKQAKEFINSIYGCAVTRVLSDEIVFGLSGWTKQIGTTDYTKFENTKRGSQYSKIWTTYQIGVWVTAWARYELWDVLKKLDKIALYTDTDSIKFKNKPWAWDIINSHNRKIQGLTERAATHAGLSSDLWCPVSPDKEEEDGQGNKVIKKGKPQHLGFFDREHDASEFKTLGAKRYCYKDTKTGKMTFTVAGLPKKADFSKIGTVEDFKIDTEWNEVESKKLTTHYLDNIGNGEGIFWVDRNGEEYESFDKFGIALVPTTFKMSIGGDYEDFLNSLNGSDWRCESVDWYRLTVKS